MFIIEIFNWVFAVSGGSFPLAALLALLFAVVFVVLLVLVINLIKTIFCGIAFLFKYLYLIKKGIVEKKAMYNIVKDKKTTFHFLVKFNNNFSMMVSERDFENINIGDNFSKNDILKKVFFNSFKEYVFKTYLKRTY